MGMLFRDSTEMSNGGKYQDVPVMLRNRDLIAINVKNLAGTSQNF